LDFLPIEKGQLEVIISIPKPTPSIRIELKIIGNIGNATKKLECAHVCQGLFSSLV
jgi:hypothetical protein